MAKHLVMNPQDWRNARPAAPTPLNAVVQRQQRPPRALPLLPLPLPRAPPPPPPPRRPARASSDFQRSSWSRRSGRCSSEWCGPSQSVFRDSAAWTAVRTCMHVPCFFAPGLTPFARRSITSHWSKIKEVEKELCQLQLQLKMTGACVRPRITSFHHQCPTAAGAVLTVRLPEPSAP
jgi:hypothetical protein